MQKHSTSDCARRLLVAALAILVIDRVAIARLDDVACKLQGFDVLVLPDEKVTLQAKLERVGVLGVNPDVHGQEIVFRFGEREIGRAITGDDGLATLEWRPPAAPRGMDDVRELGVTIPPGSHFVASPSVLRVFIRDPKRPCIVVDLDGTVCASPGLDVLTKPASEIEACAGAADALTELARHYDPIYLTARDDAIVARSREWLDLRGFPRGPVLVRDLKLTNLSAESYKIARLRELRRRFTIVAGIGDRKEDARAYLAAGIIAILLGDEDDVPRGARKLVTWAEVAKLLRQ